MRQAIWDAPICFASGELLEITMLAGDANGAILGATHFSRVCWEVTISNFYRR